jgi:hypothetical protein
MDNNVVPCAKPVGQEKVDGLLTQWSERVLGHLPEYKTSLPMETSDDRLGVYAIAESECRRGADLINTELVITDYICHECLIQGKGEGELINAIRTILLGPKMQPVQFVSRAAVEFVLKTARHEPGMPAWDPPIKLTLKQVPCRGGHTYKFIIDRPAKKGK